ncbi:MAG: hypothetical protein ACI4U3_08840 [Traorella sp.]
MNVNEFREIIRHLEYVNEISQGNWYDEIEKCWKKEIEILSKDIEGTIEFLKNECTNDEYTWISEIIDDLIEVTQSRELLKCYKDLMLKFPDECKIYNIKGSIECAENLLVGDDNG